MIRILQSNGLSSGIEEEGLSSPHLVFLLRQLLRCSIELFLHPKSVTEYGRQWKSNGILMRERIKPVKDVNPNWTKSVNKATKNIRSDGVVIKIGRHNLMNILAGALPSAIIVSVDCSSYYRLCLPLYKESHFLALLPAKDKLVICDSYERNGYQEITNWKQHMAQSGKFDWSRWEGDAVLVFSTHHSQELLNVDRAWE